MSCSVLPDGPADINCLLHIRLICNIQDHYISMENINANDSLWIIELGSP